MSSTVTINIPERLWKPIKDAPKDGRIVYVRNLDGEADLAYWAGTEWSSELGYGDYVAYADLSISHPPAKLEVFVPPVLTAEEIGNLEYLRLAIGLEQNDDSQDMDIAAMSPMRRVRLLARWKLGASGWVDEFLNYCRSQGIVWTTDLDADGIIE